MSRSGDFMSANNHQLAWTSMTRPIPTVVLVEHVGKSVPLPAVSRIHSSDSYVPCEAHSPEDRPKTTYNCEELRFLSSCIGVGSK